MNAGHGYLGVCEGMALSRTRFWLSTLLVAVAAALVSACGVKGPLEPPPAAQVAGVAKSPESQDPGQNSAAPEKAHEPFILDPLLR